MGAREHALAAQRRRIESACERAGRSPDAVRLVAVSKGHTAASIAEVAELGVTDFGESYAQELRAKRVELGALALTLRWHFVGRVQSNKLGDLVGTELIHGVDRLSVAEAIGRRATSPQPILLQVNLSGEASKAGVDAESVFPVSRAIAALSGVSLRGLMTIAAPSEDPEASRPVFGALRELRDRTRESLAAVSTDAAERFVELSMGMSDDLEVAVEEGATIVRVGTAIFGSRGTA